MKVSVRGDKEVAAKLDELAARAVDATPLWQEIYSDLLADERRRFATDGFGRWPDLKPSTVKRKQRSSNPATRANAARPLRATNQLERALTTSGGRGQLLRITATSLQFGIAQRGAAYYGQFAQTGSGAPKRLVIQATPTRRRTIRGQVRRWIVEGATR
jgi:hypothetical protein